MNSKSQVRIGAVLSYISIFLNMGIQLIYTPVMLRLLGQSEYGLYTLVFNVVSYLSLFNLGFTGAYLRFYSQAAVSEDKSEVNRTNGLFLTIFLIMGVVALICGCLLSFYPREIFGDKLSESELLKSQILMRILVVNFSLSFPMAVFNSIITSQEKFVFQKILNIIKSLANPLIAMPFLIMGYGSIAMVTVTTLITLTDLIVSMFYCFRRLNIRFAFDHFDFNKLRGIGNFSFFIFLNMIIDQLNWSIDNFILGRVVGTIEVAIYGVATQLRNVFSMFSSPISSVFAPRVNRIAARNDNKTDAGLSRLLVKVGRIQYIIILYIFVGFVFAGKKFIELWAGADYLRSYHVAIYLLFPLTFILPANLGIEIRRAKNMHRFPAIIMFVTAVINCLASIPLAIKYGAVGTALGTAISLIINTVWISIYYEKKVGIGINLLYIEMLKITLYQVGPIIFGLFGLLFSNAIQILVWAIIYSLFYIFVLIRYVLNDEEKKAITSLAYRKSRVDKEGN